MNKKAVRIGVACGILLGATMIVYAITSLFFTNSETSKLNKKRCSNLILRLICQQQKWDRGIVLM